MAITTYYIEKMEVTGTQDSPQTVLFSSLSDKTGNSLSTFSAVPIVAVKGAYQERSANVIVDSVTISQFKIALSDIGRLSSDSCYFNLKITGDV